MPILEKNNQILLIHFFSCWKHKMESKMNDRRHSDSKNNQFPAVFYPHRSKKLLHALVSKYLYNQSLKWNSPSVAQDTFIATKNFMQLISIDISMKTHQFVCIKQALLKFGCYLTFEFTF